jgi:ABC-2 type transport system permease protein
MFWKIVFFEIQNRIRRPAVYLYFAAALIFTIMTFATGSLPLGEKEHINAPYVIALWCAGITMMMMLVSSSVMGVALYRDIEYNTKDYYLTYPITKAGYFWGRYAGSFFFMFLIATSIIIGAYIGTKVGPAMGWKDPREYGPNKLVYYLHPFFTIALPNLLFTSSLFFGLVALTRNVKVIYSGGILLFLGYFVSIFFLNNTNNQTVVNLADAFGLNGVRLASGAANSIQKNTTLFPVEGTFLLNRLLWSGVGLAILLFTYIRFDFEKFFSGKRDKSAIDDEVSKVKRALIRNPKVSFAGTYNRSTLFNLAKVELTNIIRDNYFWIILLSGTFFLGFVFWMGNNEFGVSYSPRTIMLLDIFSDVFPFFIFFIIIFYTGETLHRDRLTRYAYINDSLPPPNWVLNGSKLLALLVLGLGLSFYLMFVFTILMPRLLEMVIFSYLVHVLINSKFVAHGVGVSIWVLVFFLEITGTFNYNLFMYSYTPWYGISDMDGVGHMLKPIYWFNLYWLLFGGLLIIASALFYYRGVTSSFKERLQLVKERFDKKTKLLTGVLAIAFLAVGAYNYYNVSYLNNFLTQGENENRSIIYEKTLKKYQSLPLPKVIRIKLYADLFPDKQQEFVRALVTIVNKTDQPISKMLTDGDELTDYSIKTEGKLVPFTYPLLYDRGLFNWFRPKQDTAEFHLYQFQKPLAPGDSAVLEVNSSIVYKGFQNGLYAKNLLHNGTFFNGGLPGLGYDDDDEQSSNYVRKKNGLAEKKEEEIAQDDPKGIATLKAGNLADLLSLDVTVSTSGDQIAIAPGELTGQWKQNGRNYFHYVQDKPGMYVPVGILSARFAVLRDSIQLDHQVNISIFYHPDHNANLQRFVAAYKDGLRYYAAAYGPYPFKDIRLAETSPYGPHDASMATMDSYAEYNAWNAHFNDPNQFDFCYFNTTKELAQQWWRFQVAPNSTVGSLVIPEGLSTYSALVMAEKKYGKNNIKSILQDQLWYYLFIRRRLEGKEHPLIKADQWHEWGGKASVALYGLRDLIGEDSMNVALREFKNAYAFKSKPPYAGSNDLYRYLQKHVPDSLQYYLADTWQKITLYDNKMTDVKAVSTGNKNEYKVTLKVDVNKAWIDGKGNDIPAKSMNDYIDIGVFAANSNNKEGRSVVNPLYLKKYKLTYGQHTISVVVKEKPVNAGIDPYAKLIDRQPNDNMKDF